MSHPWWVDIDWKKLERKEVIPPFKPNLGGEKWLQNFDEEFVKEGMCFFFLLLLECLNSF